MNLIDRAAEFAARAHAGQIRKDGVTPYFAHCAAVALSMARAGHGEAAIAAALCHDVPEDTAYSISDIEHTLGSEVALLVDTVTEPPKDRSWKERKEWILEVARTCADYRVPDLLAADKGHNLRTIAGALRTAPHTDPFERLNASRDEKEWFYRELAAILGSRDTPLTQALADAVDEVFGAKPRT